LQELERELLAGSTIRTYRRGDVEYEPPGQANQDLPVARRRLLEESTKARPTREARSAPPTGTRLDDGMPPRQTRPFEHFSYRLRMDVRSRKDIGYGHALLTEAERFLEKYGRERSGGVETHRQTDERVIRSYTGRSPGSVAYVERCDEAYVRRIRREAGLDAHTGESHNTRAKRSSVPVAIEYLERALADGPQDSVIVEEGAISAGISPKTLVRARKQRGVIAEKEVGGRWTQRLPAA
jgi:hypothetical protein